MLRPEPQRGYTTRFAARVAGLTPAMVDYLCRSRTVVPGFTSSPGRGRPRLYTYGDLVALRAVAQLLGAGVSVAKVRRAFKTLQQWHPDRREALAKIQYLVTDGVRVYYRSPDQLLQDLKDGQLAFSFVVELGRIARHVTECVERIAAGRR